MNILERLKAKGNFTGDIETVLPLFLSKVEKKDFDGALEVLTAFPAHGKVLLWKDSKATEVIMLLELLTDIESGLRIGNKSLGDYHTLYGLALRDKGQLQKAISHLKKALDAFKNVNVQKYIETLCDIVGPLRIIGEFDKALHFADEALINSEKLTPIETANYWRHIALRLIGNIENLKGNFDSAEQNLLQSLPFWEDYAKSHDSQPLGMIHCFLTRVYLDRRDNDAAQSLNKAANHANAAFSLADNQKFGRDYVRAILLQAEIHLRKGDMASAKKLSDQALERANILNIAEQLGDSLYLSAQIALALGDVQTARGLIAELRQEQMFAEYAYLQKKAAALL